MFSFLHCSRLAVTAAAILLAPAPAGAVGGILTTRHNLSVSGPGDLKATREERVCIFCHTPHHASPVTPLWSRPTSSTVYDLYQSSTLTAKPGQPSGASRLCLSCHDGTIALGAMYGADPGSNVIDMAGGVTRMPQGRPTNLGGATGSSLGNDHPVSFPYTSQLTQSNGQLKSPAELPRQIRLEQGMLQCTACHNPHRDPYGKFLVMDNSNSALCLSCHEPAGWSGAGHALNAATAAGGCGNCHASHNGNAKQRLLKSLQEEQNCLLCHKSGGSGKDINGELTKSYSHPVSQYTGVHDEAENVLTAPKHVACEDCHNPHQAKGGVALPPAAGGSLLGVKGVSAGKAIGSPAPYEYEICFRCHADNNYTPPQSIVRQIQEVNLRLEFSTLNPAFHPVEGQGQGTSVPSLRSGYSTASMIYCCDCHGSDDSTKGGGSGPNGPHGSIYPHILIARYETDSYPLAYQDALYALCYRCHDQQVLLDPGRSRFPRHQSHVAGYGIPCSVCHDSHGVSALRGGTTRRNAHLINFDTRFVSSGSYDSIARTCTVSCHQNNPQSY
jgi:predicted CXXCH cytochrome family protein